MWNSGKYSVFPAFEPKIVKFLVKCNIIYVIILCVFHNLEGFDNCMHGDKRSCNVHANRFSDGRNYVHVNQLKYF